MVNQGEEINCLYEDQADLNPLNPDQKYKKLIDYFGRTEVLAVKLKSIFTAW